jgi:gamma-glutamylcyclotransferase (GGCT)/AIG2-like uncharacterized protein YtfP
MATRFFVYGTLKQGEANSHVWPHEPLSVEYGVLAGADLYDLGHFPAIVDGGDAVGGEVWTIADEHAAETLRRLDRLEGYHGDADDLYDRRIVAVETEDGVVACWAYFLKRLGSFRHAAKQVQPDQFGVLSWNG